MIIQPYWTTICVSENNYDINNHTPKLIKNAWKMSSYTWIGMRYINITQETQSWNKLLSMTVSPSSKHHHVTKSTTWKLLLLVCNCMVRGFACHVQVQYCTYATTAAARTVESSCWLYGTPTESMPDGGIHCKGPMVRARSWYSNIKLSHPCIHHMRMHSPGKTNA